MVLKVFTKQSRVWFAVSLGLMILAIALVVWGAPYIINRQIQKNIQIDNSSQMFEKWRKLPVPLDFKIYVFNVTNSEEINNGEKPKLAEIGPYVYKEYREKTILGYGANDTVKYMLKKTFYFAANESGSLSEDDDVVVVNLSYMAALLAVNDLMPSFVGMVNQALEEFFSNLTDPFLRVKVKDLFFDGIYLNCEGESSGLGLVCGKIKADMPPTMRPSEDGKGFYFSMFSHLNRTESGPYEMIRGTENVYDLGHIVSYKGKNVMSQWGDKYCGMLNGSDSSIFPPINPNHVPKRLYTFEPDICRSLYVSLVGKRNIFDLSSYYYEISESALAAKSAVPANKCFCRKNWSGSHDGCLLMGVINLEPCQGAPAVASLPHFYLASEELLQYFHPGSDIKPDKEKHNSYVYLDPVTGVVLKGVKRMQFNIELRQLPGAPQVANVPTGLFPLLWMEEGAELPPSILADLQSSHAFLGHIRIVPWVILVTAMIIAAISTIALVRSGGLPMWPKNNSVSFILRPNVSAQGNKVQ
ncbi:sensory neuron membrane protein 2-like [Hyposmocoma kahamanoa]|uniref:sensory neuron membrane protein 2-like n=1 Tax=Hyposmocoma kahamanoa TaxID=1477025 RepID=UPI000E6D792A|nr:sensory neuron membrane protein 2-like [Hyposmocoma kahamanoa]